MWLCSKGDTFLLRALAMSSAVLPAYAIQTAVITLTCETKLAGGRGVLD